MLLPLVLLIGAVASAVEPYPFTDPDLLAMRRVETEALNLALKKSGKARLRYARTAVVAHQRRMKRLGPELAAAEAAVEREGAGQRLTLLDAYPAAEARQRALAAGSAMARLLDDLRPGWNQEPGRNLADLLDEATEGVKPLLLSDDPQGAEAEARKLSQELLAEGTVYLTQPGYGLTVRAPLTLVDDDPFAAIALKDNARYYRGDVAFTTEAGTFSARGHGAFVDVGEVRVVGLDREKLLLSHEGTDVVLTGEGIDMRLRGAVYHASRSGMTVDVVPDASMDPDPAVFALSGLIRTAGRKGAPATRARQLREDNEDRCAAQVRSFEAMARSDDPMFTRLYAQTVLLGDAPGFRTESPEAAPLGRLLAAFWRCAEL